MQCDRPTEKIPNNGKRTCQRYTHKGIDEQLIMERTGHRSLEGVRSYKRTDEQQQIAVSNVLQQNAPGLQAQNAQQFPHQKRSAVWTTVGSLSLKIKTLQILTSIN